MKSLISIILLLIPVLAFSQGMQPAGGGVVSTFSCNGNCSDAFTGTTVALATHDPKWTSAGGYNVADASIDGSGHLQKTANYNAVGAYYSDSTQDTSQIVVKAGSEASVAQSKVCVRLSASSKGYCLNMAAGASSFAPAIQKNGVYLHDVGGSYALDVDHTIKITASGTSTVTITAYIDGSQYDQTTDSSSPIGAGNPGFILYAGTNQTLNKMDDWQDH